MTALRSFIRGLRIGFTSPRLLLTLYVINLAVALPAALMFRNILHSAFGDSMAIERFLDGFDFAIFQDVLTQAGPAMGSFFVLLFWVLLGYIFVATLLAGGILTYAGGESERFSLREFFGGCGQYFSRFFRLFVIYALLILVIMTILAVALGGIFSVATREAVSEVSLVVWGVVLGSAAVTVLGLLIVMLDFGKIVTVRADLRSMLKATGQSVTFTLRHLFSVLIAVVLVLLVLAVGTVAYLWIASAVGMGSDGALAVMFVFQQIYVLFRISLRVAFYGCELQMHKAFAPLPDQAREVATTPVAAAQA